MQLSIIIDRIGALLTHLSETFSLLFRYFSGNPHNFSSMMNIAQKKILNAIIYFVKNTNNCRKTKLFKLIYFWDFLHFKKYGRTISGYNYIAMPFGPVPIELFEQITNDELPDEFKKTFKVIGEIDEEENSKSFRIAIREKVKFDPLWLSKKEWEILEQVAFIFKESTAKQMIEITHLKNTPWDQTIKTKGLGAPIDFMLAIDNETTLEIEDIIERFQLQRDLQLNGRF